MSGSVVLSPSEIRCTTDGVETFSAAKNHIIASGFFSGSIKLTDDIALSTHQNVVIHDKQTIGSCATSDNALLGGVFVRQIGTARQSGFPQLGHFQPGGTCIVHTGLQLMDSDIGGGGPYYWGDGGTSGIVAPGQVLSFSFQVEAGALVFERHVYACWVDALPYSPNFYFRETWVDYNIFCCTVG